MYPLSLNEIEALSGVSLTTNQSRKAMRFAKEVEKFHKETSDFEIDLIADRALPKGYLLLDLQIE